MPKLWSRFTGGRIQPPRCLFRRGRDLARSQGQFLRPRCSWHHRRSSGPTSSRCLIPAPPCRRARGGASGCATGLIAQLASPLALVTALQVCALPPDPRVKVTVRPATAVVLSSSKTPDKVAVPPLAMTVSPVYESVVSSRFIVKGFESLDGR